MRSHATPSQARDRQSGLRRVARRSADEIAEEMVAAIAGGLGSRGNALLFVNGFGGTSVRALVGSHVTSLDMAGCSITVTPLDEAIAKGWDAPVHTPALRWGL